MRPGRSPGPDLSPGWIQTRARTLLNSAFSGLAGRLVTHIQTQYYLL